MSSLICELPVENTLKIVVKFFNPLHLALTMHYTTPLPIHVNRDFLMDVENKFNAKLTACL